MNVNDINNYLERARDIIGERTRAEIEYDDCIVAQLNSGMDIKRAIQAANRKHPNEALQPGPEDWADLASRYEYIQQHKVIMKRLGMKE